MPLLVDAAEINVSESADKPDFFQIFSFIKAIIGSGRRYMSLDLPSVFTPTLLTGRRAGASISQYFLYFAPEPRLFMKSMKLARYVFVLAGIYGILIVAPEYFMEIRYGQECPPAITHPEFYYGFVGLCLVFQLLFLVIAANPIRFRPIMLIAVAEKLCFTIPCIILSAQQRIPDLVLYFSISDLVWAMLFLFAYLKTPRSTQRL